MTRTPRFAGLVIMCAALSAPAGFAAAPQDAKPAQGQDKPVAGPASIAGRWLLSIQAPGFASSNTLLIKLDAKDPKKLTGTFSNSQMGADIPIKGEFSNNKLKFSMSFDVGNNSLEVDFEGKLKDDEFSGTAITAMGEFDWKATRLSER